MLQDQLDDERQEADETAAELRHVQLSAALHGPAYCYTECRANAASLILQACTEWPADNQAIQLNIKSAA